MIATVILSSCPPSWPPFPFSAPQTPSHLRALLRCCFLCCPVLLSPLGGETHLSDLSLNFTFPSILILQARLDSPILILCYSYPLQQPSVIMIQLFIVVIRLMSSLPTVMSSMRAKISPVYVHIVFQAPRAFPSTITAQ